MEYDFRSLGSLTCIVAMAVKAGVGIALLLFGLAGMNFIAELILNLILCPTILRIIQIAKKKFAM